MHRISGVVLAAGASTRMGTQKLVLTLGGEPIIRRTVRHVADAVNICVIHFARALTLRQIGEIGHEALDEPFEEGHRHDVGHGLEAADEPPNAHQVAVHRLGVLCGRRGMRRDREAAHHPGMTVADLLAQVVDDLRAGFVRAGGDVRAGHPIDEVPLQHGRVAGDDGASRLGGELRRIRQRREKAFDFDVQAGLNRRDGRSSGCDHADGSCSHRCSLVGKRAESLRTFIAAGRRE